MPAAVRLVAGEDGSALMAVMIGVGPHKGSHTAVAIGAAEEPLGAVRVRASAAQAQRLLAWAAAWPQRTWAIEGAGGLGHLLAQQLLAAGERVLDGQPKLGARVRLLAAGAVNKNDPDDARSVAIAALRSPARRPGGLPAARRAVRADCGWRLQADQRTPGRAAPGGHQAGRGSGSRPLR